MPFNSSQYPLVYTANLRSYEELDSLLSMEQAHRKFASYEINMGDSYTKIEINGFGLDTYLSVGDMVTDTVCLINHTHSASEDAYLVVNHNKMNIHCGSVYGFIPMAKGVYLDPKAFTILVSPTPPSSFESRLLSAIGDQGYGASSQSVGPTEKIIYYTDGRSHHLENIRVPGTRYMVDLLGNISIDSVSRITTRIWENRISCLASLRSKIMAELQKDHVKDYLEVH